LTTYLQELHSTGLANSDHTTLLLNAYTKLKDNSKLDSFIKSEAHRPRSDEGEDESQPPFDLDTVIRVCRQAGYYDHAAYLAKKYKRHDDYLRITIEDKADYGKALSYFRTSRSESVSLSCPEIFAPDILTNL
jgi:vacuolar protein sorting-associated protein 11